MEFKSVNSVWYCINTFLLWTAPAHTVSTHSRHSRICWSAWAIFHSKEGHYFYVKICGISAIMCCACDSRKPTIKTVDWTGWMFPMLSSCYKRQISNAIPFQEKKKKNNRKNLKEKEFKTCWSWQMCLPFTRIVSPSWPFNPLTYCNQNPSSGLLNAASFLLPPVLGLLLELPPFGFSSSLCTLVSCQENLQVTPACFFSSLLSQLKKPCMPVPLSHCPWSSRNATSTR